MKSLKLMAGISLFITIFSARAEAWTKDYSCEPLVHAESGVQHDSAPPSFSLPSEQFDIGGNTRFAEPMVLRLGERREVKLDFCGGVGLKWGDFNFSFWDMIRYRTVFVKSYCSGGYNGDVTPFQSYHMYFTTDQSELTSN